MSAVTLSDYRRLFSLISPILWPYLYFRCMTGREEFARLSERWGKNYAQSRPTGRLVWCHAVSVGESVAALHLAEHILRLMPDTTILITTNTVTARQKIAAHSSVIHAYQPLDNRKSVERFLRYWQPDMALFFESDFWPELMIAPTQQNIPSFVVSAQLSERAFTRWQQHPRLAAHLFSAPDKYFAVDKRSADRIMALASGPSSTSAPQITISGSLKLPPYELKTHKTLVTKIATQAQSRMTILLASSHDGEEELVLRITQKARDDHRLFLIIAPRHPARSGDIAKQTQACLFHSEDKWRSTDGGVFIYDSMGDMDSLYAAADMIILGGSFVDKGGHNPIEPARAGVAVLTGPSDSKNTDEMHALAQIGLVLKCKDDAALNQLLHTKLEEFEANRPLLSKSVQKKAASYLSQIYQRPKKIAQQICQALL